MTDVMAQQGYGLSVPNSRQDVISALLNEYSTSFGRGDGASALSPVPADKELPPPPPSDSLKNKPLPAVQRAEQRMSMKFQLRVLEDAPLSPNSIPKDPSGPRPRKKIPYRSLSRDGKPASLNLVISHGSTAVIPPTPALSVRAQTFPVRTDSKSLPSPPPPPPEKSARRSNVQRKPLQQSKSQTDLARNDSLLSNGEIQPAATERPATVEAVGSVKRKALPEPAAKKFMGLGQLGTGPRGGKGGPLPPTSAPRKKSVDAQAPATEREDSSRAEQQQREAPVVNQLPPTPEDDKSAPALPRKAAALGLPSNPRARGGPISPKHVRGKSSTGFGLLKAARPAPPPPTKIMETLTPEMTPSPTLMPAEPKDQAMSPLSPLPPPKEQRRPFSFEPASAPNPPPQIAEQPKSALPTITPPSVTVPPAPVDSPIRPSSADLYEPSPVVSPVTASPPASAPQQSQQVQQPQQPKTSVAAPALTIQASPVTFTHPALLPPSTEETPSPASFTPLTRGPITLPETLIPAITTKHLSCYVGHQNSIMSSNTWQPMGCMICKQNDRERKWCCTWCQLRICTGCSQELFMVPGRNLRVYLDGRERVENENGGLREESGNEGGNRNGNAGVVLSAVYERDEDFS